MTIQQPLSAAALYDFDDLIHEDKVHRLIYTDEAIFREEMRKIFGAVWVFLAHESQIPENDDFVQSNSFWLYSPQFYAAMCKKSYPPEKFQ